jgi:hypothetical protein
LALSIESPGHGFVNILCSRNTLRDDDAVFHACFGEATLAFEPDQLLPDLAAQIGFAPAHDVRLDLRSIEEAPVLEYFLVLSTLASSSAFLAATSSGC